MKKNIKTAIIMGLAVVAFASCEKTIKKSDFDHQLNPANLPTGLAALEPKIYMTKVKFMGEINCDLSTLADYGFIYASVDTVDKYGSLKEALLKGAVPSYDGVISVKSGDNKKIETIYNFNPKKEIVYATYAISYDGLVCSKEIRFLTDSCKYAPLVDLNGSHKETDWSAPNWNSFNLTGEGEEWKIASVMDPRKATGFQSIANKGPRSYKRDNYLVLSERTMGFDMKIDYLIYPTGKTVKGCNGHHYDILISTEEITEENCSKAVVLDSLTYNFEGNDNIEITADQRFVKRSVNIPEEFEYKKVWVAVRHKTTIDKPQGSLFIEEFKLY